MEVFVVSYHRGQPIAVFLDLGKAIAFVDECELRDGRDTYVVSAIKTTD